MKEPAVNIKGTKSGITLVLDPDMDFDELKEEIRKKFVKSQKFFGDAMIALSFEKRELTDDEKFEISKIISENTDLNIVYITEENPEKEAFMKQAVEDRLKAIDASTGKFYKGTLRNGQVIDFETSIIVLGDVNAGAQVVSKGNIIVLGALNGNAFAGAGGNRNVFVAALNMNPTQIRIGDSIARAQDSDYTLPKHTGPMIAFYEDGNIYIEPLTRAALSDINLN